MKKVIKVFNRDIPLTKLGMPNKRYLTLQEKAILNEYLKSIQQKPEYYINLIELGNQFNKKKS